MLLVPEALEVHKREMARALEERRVADAIEHARQLSGGRAARILREAPADLVLPALEAMDPPRAGRVLAHFAPRLAAELLAAEEPRRGAELLGYAPPDRAARILAALEEMDADKATAVARVLPEDRAVSVRQLRQYRSGSAGAVMSPHFLAIPAGTTVGATLDAVDSAPAELERTSYVYVLNGQRKLVGVVSLRDILRIDPGELIDEVMEPHVVAVHVDDEAVEAARTMRNRRFMMLPVLAPDDTVVGVITFDRAMQILNDEVASQFVRFGAAPREESFFTPPMVAARGRLPWMAGNVFLNLGAVAVIGFFESTIAQVAILAAFIPMITDMGGNVGIQALTVAIRSIALGEVRLRDFWRATRKEVAIGLVNGLVLGVLFGVIALVLRGNPWLGLAAGAALGANVFVAGVVGGSLPFIIKRFGRDPAMMTGPILTTITDITGVTIYLGLSTLLLTLILA